MASWIRRVWYVVSGRRARVERAAVQILAGLNGNPHFQFGAEDADDAVRQANAVIDAVDRNGQ